MSFRITDRLTRNVINAAISANRRSTHIDILQRPMILKLLEEIRNCGVPFYIKVNKSEEGGFSLVGNDKLKLLQKLPAKFVNCQPTEYYQTVKDIWEVHMFFIKISYRLNLMQKFYELYKIIKSKHPCKTPEEIKKDVSQTFIGMAATVGDCTYIYNYRLKTGLNYINHWQKFVMDTSQRG